MKQLADLREEVDEMAGVARQLNEARETLDRYAAHYRGWLPNAAAPEIFARHMATVHVPRRFYVELLPGIPTIRVFEALACGIPLLSAPWDDCEHLFTTGQDFVMCRSGGEMQQQLTALQADPARRAALVTQGLATIRARHTCAHRVDELLAILATLQARPTATPVPTVSR